MKWFGNWIQDQKDELPNHFNKMPIDSLEDKKEILWNAKIRFWDTRNALDSKNNKTDNHMKEV